MARKKSFRDTEAHAAFGETLDDLRNHIVAEREDLREALERTKLKRTLATLLVGMRKRKGLTQSAFAKAAGWDKGFVSRLESIGERLPTLETIVHYARVCNADLRLHIEGDDRIESVKLSDGWRADEEQQATNPFEKLLSASTSRARTREADQ